MRRKFFFFFRKLLKVDPNKYQMLATELLGLPGMMDNTHFHPCLSVYINPTRTINQPFTVCLFHSYSQQYLALSPLSLFLSLGFSSSIKEANTFVVEQSINQSINQIKSVNRNVLLVSLFSGSPPTFRAALLCSLQLLRHHPRGIFS